MILRKLSVKQFLALAKLICFSYLTRACRITYNWEGMRINHKNVLIYGLTMYGFKTDLSLNPNLFLFLDGFVMAS